MRIIQAGMATRHGNGDLMESGHSVPVVLVGKAHHELVHKRRVRVLAAHLASLIPSSGNVSLLDVGCGDGTIASLISQKVTGLKVTGAEFAPRSDCAIPCVGFDGTKLPFPDQEFDGCMFVDVLHHSNDPLVLVSDALRVSRSFVLIKDHLRESALDYLTLRFMDWVGNRPHGVVLPYTYLSRMEWVKLYLDAGLQEVRTESTIPIYPAPFSWLFGRKLHFISILTKP